MSIEERVRKVLRQIPSHVTVVAAVKTRSAQEVLAMARAGVGTMGENYVQEARTHVEALRGQAESMRIEMIGHLQRNKARDAVRLFDRIQTVDSLRLAGAIDAECARIDRIMPILIEINSAREPQKAGALPEEAERLIDVISRLPRIRIEGLMTMGPAHEDPETLRPYFRETRELFDALKGENRPNVTMETLSMGMSNSYGVAIDEGSTMIRLGTLLFGPRAS